MRADPDFIAIAGMVDNNDATVNWARNHGVMIDGSGNA
jgi:hypothetical protein